MKSRAAHDVGAVEQTLGLRHGEQCADLATAARLAENRHVVGIAAESRNIVAHPFKGRNAIQHPDIGRAGEFLTAQLGQVQIPENIQAMIHRDHHHVVLLSVAMAPADALLNALRIPRQIVVHDERAELEIDALRPRLRSDHDASLFAEIIHEGGSHVRSL